MPEISTRAVHPPQSIATSSSHWTVPVPRPPARSILERLATWLGLDAWTETGAYLCPICMTVYDDHDAHACLMTAYCMDCDTRTVIDAGHCSTCESRSYVLARRGL